MNSILSPLARTAIAMGSTDTRTTIADTGRCRQAPSADRSWPRMAEQRDVSARNPSPIVTALRLALEEIAERRAAEKAERRAKLRVVDGRRRDAA